MDKKLSKQIKRERGEIDLGQYHYPADRCHVCNTPLSEKPDGIRFKQYCLACGWRSP